MKIVPCPGCNSPVAEHLCPHPPRRYRRKPVVVTAQRVQYPVTIVTLGGPRQANSGDYVIEDSEGVWVPCKPEMFEAIYEPA